MRVDRVGESCEWCLETSGWLGGRVVRMGCGGFGGREAAVDSKLDGGVEGSCCGIEVFTHGRFAWDECWGEVVVRRNI